MKTSKSLLFLLVVLVGLVFIGFISTKKYLPFTKQVKISPDILYLTRPTTSFSGKIDKIQGNTLWVSQTFSLQQLGGAIPTTTSSGQPPVMPTPMTKTITLRVKLTQKTPITRPPVYVPYLFKTPSPSSPPQLTLKDLKVGTFVDIITDKDLRTMTGNEIEALSIQLLPISHALMGKIVSLKNNIIVLETVPPQISKETSYTITVTQETEISRIIQPSTINITPQPPKPEELSFSDLKPQMQVTVYTDGDVTTQTQLTALRIEPQISVAAPVPQVMATPTINEQ